MARELNSLFMANPTMESQRHRVFYLQDFPPITVPTNFTKTNTFEPPRGVPTFHNYNNGYTMQSSYYGGPPAQPANDVQHSTKGYGKITWLSSKAGLITNQDGTTISFQAKEFCDQGVNDLLQVLRVGFTLKYHAIMSDGEQYTATQAVPVHGPEANEIFANGTEINLEAENPTPANAKDTYCPELEREAYEALLGTFQRQATNKLQLSNLHSQILSQGDERLFRYVGSSSMKRRTFVERRTHLFFINNDDSIYLQYPAVFQAVYLLSTWLLTRGGVSSIQDLFDYYVSNSVEQSIKEYIGSTHQDFMSLLCGHQFIFAVFPSKTYVSARRNLPNYDYAGFIEKNFPTLYSPRRQPVVYRQHHQHHHPRGVQRTTSVPMGDNYGMGYNSNGHMQRNQYQYPNQYNVGNQQQNGGRLMSLLDSHLVSPHLENQWSANGAWPSNESSNMYNENSLANEFGNLMQLRENSTKTSVGTQADEPSNVQTCTCQCTCDRGRSGSVASTRNANAGTIGSSRALPTILPGVSNLTSNGFLGNRPLSMSTASSDEQPPVTDSYNLFGPNNILSGSIDSFRFGNL